MKRRILTALATLSLSVFIALGWFTRDLHTPIPSDEKTSAARFIGSPQQAQPLPKRELESHPFLHAQGQNSMHNDSYQSDSYRWNGPLGNQPIVSSMAFHPLVGNCVAAVQDLQDRLISTCVTPFGVTLVARDKHSLDILARKKITHWLPIGAKFGGGVYFHLDHKGRVLLASNAPAIELWSLNDTDGELSWQQEQKIELSSALNRADKREHRVIDVMPDWQGNYWFITRGGLVGSSDRDGNNIQVAALKGEGIDNALAVGPLGVFTVSDHAMYRWQRNAEGQNQMVWRAAYDRGSAPKPGTMGHGSGTTPTLIGNDYVGITDNADGQVNLLVYPQLGSGQQQTFCQQPVFPADKGTSENSLSSFGNSLIIENNFGYQGPFNNITAEPGLARIDILPEQNRCEIIWENRHISSPSAVPKVSLESGLIYIYTRDASNPEDLQAWYFTAINAHTGELAFKQLTGIGPGFNNHYGSISITPDGTAYVGVLQGVIKIKDSVPSNSALLNTP